MIVVDASIAAKWLLPEDDSAEATLFLRAHRRRLVAPELVLVEVASAIVRRANIDSSLHDDALAALRLWAAWPIDDMVRRFRLTPGRMLVAGRLALRLGHPVADCVYLALAIEFDCELATSDARFAGKARTLWPRVRQLADYATPAQ